MSKKFMGLLVGAFIIVGGFFFWTLYSGSGLAKPFEQIASSPAPSAPAIPLPPSVSLSLRLARSGNTLIIDWKNLPENTLFLNILRRLKKDVNSPWELWKQIEISKDQLGSGKAEFNIGSQNFSNYSFSVQTVGNISNQAGQTTGETITWTSPTSTPAVAPTSTPPASPPPSGGPNTPTPTSTATSTVATSTATSTQNNNNGGSTTTPTTTPSGTPPATPTGTPYYSPQIQLSGYGAFQIGSFWVQHVDQRIQIGWQNLPADANAVSVTRSESQDGPWSVVLSQTGIDPVGPSTIQLVDNTIGGTFYYELNAKNGNAIITTYGPIALPPLE